MPRRSEWQSGTQKRSTRTIATVYSRGCRQSMVRQKRYVCAVLRPRLLRLCRYQLMAGHLCARRMYDSIRREVYWSHMKNDVCTTVQNFQSCTRNRRASMRQRRLCLFFPTELLDIFAMDLNGPLPETKIVNRLIMVMIDRFPELTKVTPTTKTAPTIVAAIFINDRIENFGIPSKVPTSNGQYFKSKCF